MIATEAKGLRDAIGQNLADKLLRGFNVHGARSYQRVADKLNSRVQKGNRKIANEALCIIAKHITMAKTKGDVCSLFDVLQGSSPNSSLSHLTLPLTDEHISVVNTECYWSGAKNWVPCMVD